MTCLYRPGATLEPPRRHAPSPPLVDWPLRSRCARCTSRPRWAYGNPISVNAVAQIETPRPYVSADRLLQVSARPARATLRRRRSCVANADLTARSRRIIDFPRRVPHPQLHERAFALLPCEIAPAIATGVVARALHSQHGEGTRGYVCPPPGNLPSSAPFQKDAMYAELPTTSPLPSLTGRCRARRTPKGMLLLHAGFARTMAAAGVDPTGRLLAGQPGPPALPVPLNASYHTGGPGRATPAVFAALPFCRGTQSSRSMHRGASAGRAALKPNRRTISR